MEDLRRLIDRRWHVPPLKQLLLHSGKPPQNGSLDEQGVQAGSCVQVFHRDCVMCA